MPFVADVEPTEDGSPQIMYGLDRCRELTKSTRDDLSRGQRRLQSPAERRLRRRPRLDPAPYPPQPAFDAPLWPIVEA